MAEPEKQAILQELVTGRVALHDSLKGVDEALAVRKPSSGRWSILECVEHLVAAEQYLLSRVTKASRSDSSTENRVREARILARGTDRARRVEAPEMARPSGRFQSLNEALSSFDAARDETIRFVQGFNDDFRFWLTDHPIIPGPVNCYEMLLMMSIHPLRHAKQIAEIRSALASPRDGV